MELELFKIDANDLVYIAVFTLAALASCAFWLLIDEIKKEEL